jgi:hypothetical protein
MMWLSRSSPWLPSSPTPNPNERGFQGIKRLAWVILGLQEFQGSCSDDGNGVLMGRWFG